MTDKSHLTPIGFAKPFDKPMSEMWIGDFNLIDAHPLLARDYKGIANGSNGVLVDCDKTFTDLSYKQFNNTDVARCITARYTASPNSHTCESSGVLIRGDNMKIRAALTPDHEEKRQNGRRMKDEGEPMFTLTAQDRHGVAILCKEHNEYGKSIRKDYEAGKVAESRHNMTQYACRKDGVTNTLSTVQKDNLLMCKYSPTLNDDSNELAINVIGNYSLSNHNASRVVTTDGIAPTVMENHGTVTAVVVNEPKVIDALYKSREPRESDTCPTLRSERTGLLVKGGVRIRRLTPRECWRLQGFPDEYFDKAKAAGISDSQLYKMAGNAVTVNVARAIGEKLKEIEE